MPKHSKLLNTMDRKNDILNKSIILAIGKSCFMMCNGCYNYFSNDKLIPKKAIIKFVKYLKNHTTIKKITVGGGDPLSRKDIIDILKCIKKEGFKINMDTTGLPFLNDTKIMLNGRGVCKKIDIGRIKHHIDILGIPLDGSNEKIIHTIRQGERKIFEKTKRILTLTHKHSIPVSVNTVVHRANIKDLDNIYKIMMHYPNIFRWQLFQYSSIGPLGYMNHKQHIITDKQFTTAIERIQKLSKILKKPIILDIKYCRKRRNAYLLIDSNGLAWCPKTYKKSKWDLKNNKRIIWGNIKNIKNIPDIVNRAFRYQGS